MKYSQTIENEMEDMLKSLGTEQMLKESQKLLPLAEVMGALTTGDKTAEKNPQEVVPNPGRINQNFMKELLKFANQVQKEKPKSKSETPWPEERDQQIRSVFGVLFSNYIKEEILKHYCTMKQWRFQSSAISSMVLPAIKVLHITPRKIPLMFEPFLQSITATYLLYTEVDTFSRLDSTQLLYEITKTWIEIQKTEICLKQILKLHLEDFKNYFYEWLGDTEATKFNRRKFYKHLFPEKDRTTMMDLIKVFIFCQKALGEDLKADITEWINSQ